MIIQLAAGLYALLIIGIISFQAALVAGAPWGHLTQGGRYQGQLPLRGRMVAGGPSSCCFAWVQQSPRLLD